MTGTNKNWIVQDAGYSVIITAALFGAMYFGFVLPFILVYPLIVSLLIVRVLRRNYADLKKAGSFSREEGNSLLDNRFFIKSGFYFVLPVVVFSYVYCDDNYAFVKHILNHNGYFLDLLYKYQPLSPLLAEGVHKYAVDPTYKSMLFLYTANLTMSAVAFLVLCSVAPLLTRSWIERTFEQSRVMWLLSLTLLPSVMIPFAWGSKKIIRQIGYMKSGEAFYPDKEFFFQTVISLPFTIWCVGLLALSLGLSLKKFFGSNQK